MAELLDSEGEPFVDGAEYLDKYGDTWRAVFDATEFRGVQKADGSLRESDYTRKPEPGQNVVSPWYEDAESVVRSSGPMVPICGDHRG